MVMKWLSFHGLIIIYHGLKQFNFLAPYSVYVVHLIAMNILCVMLKSFYTTEDMINPKNIVVNNIHVRLSKIALVVSDSLVNYKTYTATRWPGIGGAYNQPSLLTNYGINWSDT